MRLKMHELRKSISILLAFMLGACSWNSDLKWTEDVQLPDGRVLTLERWVEFKGGGSHLGDPSTESQQRFEFKHPENGSVVSWTNTIKDGRLDTLALWLDGGKPLLLTTPAYGGDLWRYKCPNPPYLVYEHIAGKWHAKPLSEIALKNIRVNLTFSPLEARDRIRRSGYHLSATETSQSFTHVDGVHREPYVIRFAAMPEQTFAEINCDRPLNYLVSREGK